MSKSSPLYEASGSYTSVCTQCANKLLADLECQYNDRKLALMVVCHYLDVYFAEGLYEDLKDSDFSLGRYLVKLNGLQYSNRSFVSYMVENLQNKAAAPATAVYEPCRDNKWSDAEMENRDIAIEAIGYDPYAGYEDEDRRFLFADLVRYFDDDTADDPFKLSQIIQIVNINNQLRKIDLAIAKLQAPGAEMRTDECKNLTDIKARLIAANDKIAKENEISVRNRSNKEIGKSTLGYLQRDLRKKGFDQAEENYYDQLTSEGTLWAINMSHKAVLDNSLFDENDKKAILETQRKMIQDLQRQLDDAQEKNRLLRMEIAQRKAEKSGAGG